MSQTIEEVQLQYHCGKETSRVKIFSEKFLRNFLQGNENMSQV